MKTQNAIPEKLQYAMETLIRVATEEGYAVAGVVFNAEPPSIGVMKNTKDETVSLFQAVTDMLSERLSQTDKIDVIHVEGLN